MGNLSNRVLPLLQILTLVDNKLRFAMKDSSSKPANSQDMANNGQLQDLRDQAKTQVFSLASDNLKGTKRPYYANQVSEAVRKQAETLAKQVKQEISQKVPYDQVSSLLLNAEHQSQMHVPVTQEEANGSSEEELELSFLDHAEIVNILTSSPEEFRSFMIARTKASIAIADKNSFKGQKSPTISAIENFGDYVIYQIDYSSLTTKIEVFTQIDGAKFAIQEINMKFGSHQQYLYEAGFEFETSQTGEQKINRLEHSIIFYLKFGTKIRPITIPEHLRISEPFINMLQEYSRNKSVQGLFEELDKVVKQQKITCQNNIHRGICRLLYKTFLASRERILSQSISLLNIVLLMFEILESDGKPGVMDQPITSPDQRSTLLKKILDEIKKGSSMQILYAVLHKIKKHEHKALKDYDCQTLIKEYANQVAGTEEERIALQILICSIYEPQHDGTPKVLLGNLEPSYCEIQSGMHKLEQCLLYLQVTLRKINLHSFFLDELKSFMLLWPMLVQLEKKYKFYSLDDLRKQMKDFFTTLRLKLKNHYEQNYYTNLIEVLSIVYICLREHFITFLGSSDSKFVKQMLDFVESMIIGYKPHLKKNEKNAQRIRILKKINSELVMPTLNDQVLQSEQEIEFYLEQLKSFSREVALSILDEGMVSSLDNMQSQDLIVSIIKSVIKNAKINLKIQKWYLDFKFSTPICEQILQFHLEEQEKSLKQAQRQGFFSTIRQIINSIPDDRKKQKLRIIVEQRTIKLDPYSVKLYLQKEDRIYLRLFVHILNGKEKYRINELKKSLKKIQDQIQNQQLSYREMALMTTQNCKDKQKLEKLLTKQILEKLSTKASLGRSQVSKYQKYKEFLTDSQGRYENLRAEFDQEKRKTKQAQQKFESLSFKNAPKFQNLDPFNKGLKVQIVFLSVYNFYTRSLPNQLNSLGDFFQSAEKSFNLFAEKIVNLVKQAENNKANLQLFSQLQLNEMKEEEIEKMLNQIFQVKQQRAIVIAKVNFKLKMLQFFSRISECLCFFLEEGQLKTELLNTKSATDKNAALQLIEISRIQQQVTSFRKKFRDLKLQLTEKEQYDFLFYGSGKSSYLNLTQHNVFKSGVLSYVLSFLIIYQNKRSLYQLSEISRHIADLKSFLRDNYDPQNNLNTKHFQALNQVTNFYDSKVVKRKSFQSLRQAVASYRGSGQESSLNLSISTLLGMKTQFLISFNKMNNPNYARMLTFVRIVQSCQITIDLNAQLHRLDVNLVVKVDGPQETKRFNDLLKYKDQAYFLKNKLQLEQQQQRKKVEGQIQVFLAIVSCIQTIQKSYQKLLNDGYILFDNQSIKVGIKNGEIQELQEKCAQAEKKCESWKKQIESLYMISYKASMLKGKIMRQFYRMLIKQPKSKAEIKKARAFANIQTVADFQPQKGSIDVQTAEGALEVIKKYYQLEQKHFYQELKPSSDRQSHYITINRFPESEMDYVVAIAALSKQKLGRHREGCEFICQKNTTFDDIQPFFYRCLNDPDSQYILVAYHNLEDGVQESIITIIQERTSQRIQRMKLTLVGEGDNHRLYRFMRNNLNCISETISAPQIRPYFTKFIEERLQGKNYGPVKVFQSAYPGLGKTFTILKQIELKRRTPEFLPFAGKVTSQAIEARLSSILSHQNSDNIDLIIQIYQIEPESYQAINNFLRQIIVHRSFQCRAQQISFDQNVAVYLQIQDERMKKVLPIIKFLLKHFPNCLTVVKEFQTAKIQLKGQKTIHYLLDHLNTYDEGKLDSIDLTPYSEYNPENNLEKKRSEQLLNRYFVEPFQKRQKPNYYLFWYWVQLFSDCCASFSGNYVISCKYFDHNVPKQVILKYKMQKIRSKFFDVLLENSIEFLSHSIQNLESTLFGASQGNKIKQIPFIIIPNNGYNWFSFIYKQFKQIPEVIRSFWVWQETLLQKNKKGREEIEKIIAQRYQLRSLEENNDKKLEQRLKDTLSEISGNNEYKKSQHSGYVLNLDNFIKMALIAYRMKVNIPLVIQGEAGIGKTMLLRHLCQHVFGYKFISHTINAGVTEDSLRGYIQQAIDECRQVQQQDQNQIGLLKDVMAKKKVCLFLDEFNTLPEAGYIKEIVMQKKFMGRSYEELQNVVIFAACNPYRQLQHGQSKLAFQVKRPPLSLGQVMWNFGVITPQRMAKYISKMLEQISQDIKQQDFVKIICGIQRKLNEVLYGSVNLRDIERFRHLYNWLKINLPTERKLALKPGLQQYLSKKPIRAAVIALYFTYFSRLETRQQKSILIKIIDENSKIKFDKMRQIKEFEEEDFASRLEIKYKGISINSNLKENLFAILICIMNRVPMLIVGSPGCSKSLASRIIIDNFREEFSEGPGGDEWIRTLPRIVEFFFQGSENCKTQSLQNRFKSAENQAEHIQTSKQVKNGVKKIVVMIFDEMGLAQASLDNPLKAIHQPLQIRLVGTEKQQKQKKQIAFVGISNRNLDLSKMSRLLVVRRAELQKADLAQTAKQIARCIFIEGKFSDQILWQYLKAFSSAYMSFIKNQATQQHPMRQFFGLRDFYNMIRTFANLIKEKQSMIISNLPELAVTSIYKNFNGSPGSFQNFRGEFLKQIELHINKQFNAPEQILRSIRDQSQRYCLVICENAISQATLASTIRHCSKNTMYLYGSPYQRDRRDTECIIENTYQIIRAAETDMKLLISNLNHSVKGSFLDLFNRFFLERNGYKAYRVATENGCMQMPRVNQSFGVVVILNKSQLSQESSAFLNRFQKYTFDLAQSLNQKSLEVFKRVQRVNQIIMNNIRGKNLGHYQLQHLFYNISNETLMSLAYVVELVNRSEPLCHDVQFLVKKCFQILSKVASEDLKEILRIFLQEEFKYEPILSDIVESINQRSQNLKNQPKAILLIPNIQLWKIYKPTVDVVELEILKSEKEILKKLESFYKNKDRNTIYVDFSRELNNQWSNLNDEKFDFTQEGDSVRVEINYILELIQKFSQGYYEKNEAEAQKKIRIVLNYNRRKTDHFSYLGFSYDWPIYSVENPQTLDEEPKVADKLSNVLVSEVVEGCFQKFTLKIQGQQTNSEISIALSNMILELCSPKSIFVQCCKQAIKTLERNSLALKDEEISQVLLNKDNIQKYKSLNETITKVSIFPKIQGPVTMLIYELASKNRLLDYAVSSKSSLFAIFYNFKQENTSNPANETARRFLLYHCKKQIKDMQQRYRQFANDVMPDKKDNFSIEMKLPTYFPYSEKEIEHLFSEQNTTRISQVVLNLGQNNHHIQVYQQEYNAHMDKQFSGPESQRAAEYYKQLKSQKFPHWHTSFKKDIVHRLCVLAKISTKNVSSLVMQIDALLQVHQFSILEKFAYIWKRRDIWVVALRIFSIMTDNNIKELMECGGINYQDLGQNLLSYSQQFMAIDSLKIANFEGDTLEAKLLNLIKIHHAIFYELSTLCKNKFINPNDPNGYMLLKIREDVLTLWQLIHKDAGIIAQDLIQVLSGGRKIIELNVQIVQFLQKCCKDTPRLAKTIYQYLANKLFPAWFSACDNQTEVKVFLVHFKRLVADSQAFTHNSVQLVDELIEATQLRYASNQLSQSIQGLKRQQNLQRPDLKCKLLKLLVEECHNKRFQDNLSVFIINNIENKLKINKSLLQEPKQGCTRADLQRLYQTFVMLIDQIESTSTTFCKLVAFAFCKVYLFYYIALDSPVERVSGQISKLLARNGQIYGNLRFYCLKLLRLKYSCKQIVNKYIKTEAYEWCGLMKQEMKEIESRSIEVPKTPLHFHSPETAHLVAQLLKEETNKQAVIGQLAESASKGGKEKYEVLGCFLKYFYSKASKGDNFTEILVNNEAKYKQLLGEFEFDLVKRYCASKFDDIFQVESAEQFDESHFIVFNTFNWLLSTKDQVSPFHSLFFNPDTQSISQEISLSFMPCGPENPYIGFARQKIKETQCSQIGIYICSKDCDYMYSHENCGWPASEATCPMCKGAIGGKGHQLTSLKRYNQGARRVISEQFPNSLYVGHLKQHPEFWDGQRGYIEAQIDRMKTKTTYFQQARNNEARKQKKLTGYHLEITNGRITRLAAHILKMCTQSIMYIFCSMGLITEAQLPTLFTKPNKDDVLRILKQNIDQSISFIRQTLALNSKFYSWVFGIQAEIFRILTDFQSKFNTYTTTIEQKAHQIAASLRVKAPNMQKLKNLYDHMATELAGGLTFGNLKEVQRGGQMTARNQFTRQLFENLVQEIVSRFSLEQKIAFAEGSYQAHGKMSFPFEQYLNESTRDIEKYCYSPIFKIPTEFLEFNQILNKYEHVISTQYPILDYILQSRDKLRCLQVYRSIVMTCNYLFQKVDKKLTRHSCRNAKLSKFVAENFTNQIEVEQFLTNWREVAMFIAGPIQVQCKIYGTMNNQLTAEDSIYNFLLDDLIKENANGKIIAALFHNFAELHNEVIEKINQKKNLVAKYRNIYILDESSKKMPQRMVEDDYIALSDDHITRKLLESSIPSIVYGENLLLTNFDSVEEDLLSMFTGRSRLETQIEKYFSVCYASEAFSKASKTRNTNAVQQVRDIVYVPLEEQTHNQILEYVRSLDESGRGRLLSEFEMLIACACDRPALLEVPDKPITKIIKESLRWMRLEQVPDLSGLPVSGLVPAFELVQSFMAPSLLQSVPQKYRKQLPAECICELKQFLQSLPGEPSQFAPSPTQFLHALTKFALRQLQSEAWADDLTFLDYLCLKQDLWPYGYDCYTRNCMIPQPVMQIKVAHAFRVLELVQGFAQ